ncbi:MAG: RHS repeat-associated core domain-containing protein [Bacteroidota bacterium]
MAKLDVTHPIGPALSLQVGAGDIIQMEAYAHFETNNYSGSNSLSSFVAAVAGAFGGINGSTIAAEQFTFDAFNNAYGTIGLQGNSNNTVPAAYLNYILFDQNMVYKQSGFKQITSASSNNTVLVSFDTDLVIPEPGFIYCFVSFENGTGRVFWDDFKVTHVEHPVIQTDDYYPFGLTFNSYERITAEPNRYKFTGKERIDDLELGWDDFGARMYDPTLGRWNHIDPLANKYDMHSPYHYTLNNPIRYIDPDGMQIEGVTKKDAEKTHEDLNSILAGKQFDALRGLITRSGKKGNGKKFNKIDSEALSEALEGLEGDDLALAQIITGAINSDDVHKIEFAKSDGVLSSDGKEAIGSQLPAYINVDATVEKHGGLPTSLVTNLGGSGITTKTETGTHSVIVEDGDHNGDRSVTTGHELFGHGRSLGLGREDSQHIDAVRTENLILRVKGMGNRQRDGTNHGDRTKIKNPKALPDFR